VAQPLTDIHSCSYFCTRPACVLAQRDALVARYVTPAQSLTWSNAPAKTVWGADMLVADVAIDADHTLTLYCEAGQEGRVQAMLGGPVAQPLTLDQIDDIWNEHIADLGENPMIHNFRSAVRAVERAHGIWSKP